ncbi:methylthioribulose-1-phosphate dehydratase [Fontibacillus phaseoli]|uniref:Methylthioribulose-1-phosphate dehydratase n=1 Tax=Fontibacillus phaseoli TaxID=1416533 RepID=A0A369BP89_9BACL|nr:methylthioribulose 1-phosphate dehydratase [Fontibacillus phaseoli]RCX23353.1 methylthioribulose-1-phosphate dehydratase [Fontibacillus phaseoli]
MNFSAISSEDKQAALSELRSITADFAARGWFPGTSGNLSLRVGGFSPDRFHFAIAASGKDRSIGNHEDFLFVDTNGEPCETTNLKPSPETMIHAKIYRVTGCGAIFHVHTVYNTMLSEYYGDQGAVPAKGIELIKDLGIWEDDDSIQIPVLPNYRDISKIAKLISGSLKPEVPGILLRNHGIYAWGKNALEAKRHLESFEFIFEVLYRSLLLPPGPAKKG